MTDEKDGVWRTVGGRRVFIKTGQSLDEAMIESGKFNKNPDATKVINDFGKPYNECSGKPSEAIEKLITEKNGYVPAAMFKEGVGDIDFVWGKGGKDGYGLAHIIERRNEQNIDGENYVKKIPKIIENGEVMTGKHSDRVYIADDNDIAIVRLDYDKEKAIWLVTAYIKE